MSGTPGWPALPRARDLDAGQLDGTRCALCGAEMKASRHVGTVITGVGALIKPIDLRACSPACRATPERAAP